MRMVDKSIMNMASHTTVRHKMHGVLMNQKRAVLFTKPTRFLVLSLFLVAGGLTSSLILGGCNAHSGQKNLPMDRARELNAKGSAAKTPAEAKTYFEQAVQTDPMFGPAQYNLGLAQLQQKQLYAAAQSFDRASKLMPNDPLPRIGLALVYESANQFDRATEAIEQALVISPELIDAIQILARLRVQQDHLEGSTLNLLRTIRSRGTTEDWRLWAGKLLIKYGEPATQPG